VIFVLLKIIAYPTIIDVNLPYQFEISGEVYMQMCYKVSVTSVLNYILKCNSPKNNTFLTHVKSNACVYSQILDSSLS
jgi:hypothetical protein